jgi:glucose-fructose oxidoreductase
MARKKVRYAVVGLGWISQKALLPAFANASDNSELTALVSGDPEKLKALGDDYDVDLRVSYDQFEQCLESGKVDAVYIGTPNSRHREFTERAARAGVHVLCEKPMAPTVEDCQAMISACEAKGVKLMIAYRLHFDEANMTAVKRLADGDLGEPRAYSSVFTEPVEPGNIRLRKDLGGGPMEDIGVYCVNAARYLFRAEPVEAFAFQANGTDPRFREVGETVAATLRFPGDRLAQFTCSFGAASVNSFRVACVEGDLRMDPAFGFQGERRLFTTIGGKTSKEKFQERDQFAPQLRYFSDCVLNDTHPEPDGREGLADVRILQALHASIAEGRPVRLEPFEKSTRPSIDQVIKAPAPRRAKVVKAAGPSGN